MTSLNSTKTPITLSINKLDNSNNKNLLKYTPMGELFIEYSVIRKFHNISAKKSSRVSHLNPPSTFRYVFESLSSRISLNFCRNCHSQSLQWSPQRYRETTETTTPVRH